MISRRYGFFMVLALLTLSCQLEAKAGPEFNMLKFMLGSRQQEPKMYLPASVVLGSDLEVLVVAPGAKCIKLISSKEPGETDLNGTSLKVAPTFTEIGEQLGSRAEFKVKLDPEKDAELLNKFCYFEALVTYEDAAGRSLTRTANFYGSNAAYSNVNAVKIIPIKQESAGAGMAKALMPGFFNQNQNQKF